MRFSLLTFLALGVSHALIIPEGSENSTPADKHALAVRELSALMPRAGTCGTFIKKLNKVKACTRPVRRDEEIEGDDEEEDGDDGLEKRQAKGKKAKKTKGGKSLKMNAKGPKLAAPDVNGCGKAKNPKKTKGKETKGKKTKAKKTKAKKTKAKKTKAKKTQAKKPKTKKTKGGRKARDIRNIPQGPRGLQANALYSSTLIEKRANYVVDMNAVQGEIWGVTDEIGTIGLDGCIYVAVYDQYGFAQTHISASKMGSDGKIIMPADKIPADMTALLNKGKAAGVGQYKDFAVAVALVRMQKGTDDKVPQGLPKVKDLVMKALKDWGITEIDFDEYDSSTAPRGEVKISRANWPPKASMT